MARLRSDEYFVPDLAVRGPFAVWQAAGGRDTTALARARAAEMSTGNPAALDDRRAQTLADKLAEGERAIADD